MKVKYKVVGNDTDGYAVVDQHGAIEYDLIGTKELAKDIRKVLNKGGDPSWNVIEPKLSVPESKRIFL